MKYFCSLLATLSRARTACGVAIGGLWLALCTDSFVLIPPQGKYGENTETVPAAETITGGGIRMKIGNTIWLPLLRFLRCILFSKRFG